MTNNSNQHIKVAKNQTLGMLKSCEQEQYAQSIDW